VNPLHSRRPGRTAAIAASLVLSAFSAETTPPNVLLICVDDLKPLLGCYGDSTVRTPELDKLAAGSALFERAYCNQALCAPSRVALMTGLRPSSLGLYGLSTNFREVAPDAVTVAQYFRRHGWRTESLGKVMHAGHGNREDAASWSVPHWFPAAEKYALESNRPGPGETDRALHGEDARGAPTECADVPDDFYADGQIAAEAVRRLRAAQGRPDTPFFLAVGFIKPHLPFCAPRRYWDLYQRGGFVLPIADAPRRAPAYAPADSFDLRKYRGLPESGPIGGDLARELTHGYHAAVSYVDAQIGRVLTELDRLGLARNTIVVVWGDHGWHLGDHGQWSKRSNYEEAMRVPFILRFPPRTPPGARLRTLVETVDIYPTLAELAGLPAPAVPQALDGTSFAPQLHRPSANGKAAVFHVCHRERAGGYVLGRAVRTDRHRLVEWMRPGASPETAEMELYDYLADPLETENVAADQPEVVARLRSLLQSQPLPRPSADLPRSAGGVM